jgi:aldose sugar dehydrogenase
MFYTERERGLWVVRADQPTVNVLSLQAPGADASSALLSVAVDPDFARTRTVYVCVAERSAGYWRGRVIRLRLDTSLAKVTDRQDIATDIDWGASAIATRSVDDLQLGGRLRFGPGGHLYLGLGDGRSPTAPQSATALGGKVLRLARDGTAAAGNPALPGFDPRVFAYGFRQPMGLSFHPNTEDLVLAERGGEHPDEITIVKPGANGGWDPRCAGQASDAYCGHIVSAGVAGTMTDIGRHPNATMPTWRGLSGGEGLSSSVVLRDPAWKDWNNALVVAFSRAKRIDLIKMDHLGQLTQQGTLLSQSLFGFQAVAQGPDGLYAVTSGKAGGEEIWQLLLR